VDPIFMIDGKVFNKGSQRGQIEEILEIRKWLH
jgi:hypothetical protein